MSYNVTGLLTKTEVLNRLRAEINRAGSQSKLAQEWGVMQSTLSEVLRGERGLPESLISKMGLVKPEVYEESAKPI